MTQLRMYQTHFVWTRRSDWKESTERQRPEAKVEWRVRDVAHQPEAVDKNRSRVGNRARALRKTETYFEQEIEKKIITEFELS